MTNKLEKVFRGMVYILPGVLFFSYQPLMHFGASESMNFEISLPLIWLVLFDGLTIWLMARKKMLLRGFSKKWIWLFLPVWLTLSVFWSLNSLRGLLTVGIIWLLYLAIDGIVSLKGLFDKARMKETFWKFFFGSTLVVCAWCWIQCVLDLVGVPREYSLMCAGCTYQMFGFPHPDGFAIEPQFMGNLLLAPSLTIGWLMLHSRAAGANSRTAALRNAASSKHYAILFFIVVATLFLTFSRGAIYAFAVGMMAMGVWELARRGKEIMKRLAAVWVMVVCAFVVTLCVQGVMAAASPTNDTFRSGVAKVLNHLTLGIVDVREPENGKITGADVVENSVEKSDGDGDVNAGAEVEVNQIGEVVEQEAAFDGYVAESTDTRLRLTSAAVKVWHQDFTTVMFGVGLGGAGRALYINGLSPAPKEIVQNQYASLLLETGIIGVTLVILSLILVVRVFWKSEMRLVLICLMVAYMISLIFFSGLPNALHIYLLPVVLYAIGGTYNKNLANFHTVRMK